MSDDSFRRRAGKAGPQGSATIFARALFADHPGAVAGGAGGGVADFLRQPSQPDQPAAFQCGGGRNRPIDQPFAIHHRCHRPRLDSRSCATRLRIAHDHPARRTSAAAEPHQYSGADGRRSGDRHAPACGLAVQDGLGERRHRRADRRATARCGVACGRSAQAPLHQHDLCLCVVAERIVDLAVRHCCLVHAQPGARDPQACRSSGKFRPWP